ncbi:MAG: helix-turn-helix domain-containing protein [Gemmataceae bacterium]
MLPENEAARQAVDRVRACVRSGRKRRAVNPLFLHGPAGTGKTRLVTDLAPAVTLHAGELGTPRDDGLTLEGDAELVAVEDVQRLPANATHTLAALVDRCKARQVQLVCTANAGPALLPRLPQRLVSRLASGLVVGLEPLGVESRRRFLGQALAHHGRSAPRTVIDFLAATLPGSGRAVEGAAARLEHLGTLDEVKAAFADDGAAPTVDRIVTQVGRYFEVDPGELCSARRSREVLVPRQVSMYLARRLTSLSLVAIGERFGGRDHSTVLHACRKIEEDIETDANLSRAVRELAAGLS